MNNLLPSFTQIRVDEPASTQKHALFSVSSSSLPPNRPLPVPTTSASGGTVIADLLAWSESQRLSVDSNRLASVQLDGSDPSIVSRRPKVFDPAPPSSSHYSSPSRVAPTDASARGSAPEPRASRPFGGEDRKGEAEEALRRGGGATLVAFVHLPRGGGGSANQDEEAGEGEGEGERDGDDGEAGPRYFGSYDVFLKGSGPTLHHHEVSSGESLTFSTSSGQALHRSASQPLSPSPDFEGSSRSQPQRDQASDTHGLSPFPFPALPPAGEAEKGGGADAGGTLTERGVTFSLVKDYFSRHHFDAAMSTGIYDPFVGSMRNSEEGGEGEGEGEKQYGLHGEGENEGEERGDEMSGIQQYEIPHDQQQQFEGDADGGAPSSLGLEFVSTFSSSSFGLELMEVFSGPSSMDCSLVVSSVVPGGQASLDARVRVGCLVIGVEGFPVSSLADFNAVLEAARSVDPTKAVRLHFLDMEDERGGELMGSGAGKGEGEGEGEARDGAPTTKDNEEFFVTGGGMETEQESLTAARTTVQDRTQPPPLPPPLPPDLPLRLSKSLDDKKPVTLYFQNKHSSMAMRVSWIDYAGDLVPRKELHPGESYMERTFSTHPWVCTAVDWLPPPFVKKGQNNSHNSTHPPLIAPSVSPALIVRLGDVASSALKSYTALWDPALRSLSFVPVARISAGKVRPAAGVGRSAAARIAYARAMLVQQLRDARMDPATDGQCGLGVGTPNFTIVLFGNGNDHKSVFSYA